MRGTIPGIVVLVEEDAMPRERSARAPGGAGRFGARLAALRKAAGYTQAELAADVGTTQRMMAYYERQAEHPPAHLLPALAQALGISTDDLLGVTPMKRATRPTGRLQRRLQQLEKMPPKAKRQVLQVLDTFLERERLKRQVAGG
ncbi:MAG: helix-turn-helix domain-containing protein [Nitrospiraceae bacterium]